MSEDILAKIVRMRKADIERLGLNFDIEIPEKRRVGHTEFLGNAGAILEVKRASPSKGDIAPDLNPVELATTYAEAHAQAVSVLTEMNFDCSGRPDGTPSQTRLAYLRRTPQGFLAV